MKKLLLVIPYPTRTEKLEVSRRGREALCKMAGVEVEKFDRYFQVEFALRKHPGYMNKKIVFPLKRGKRNAERIPVERRQVIFFGWNSMRAFGQAHTDYAAWRRASGDRAYEFMVLPYPIGARRWWGESENRVRTGKLLKLFVTAYDLFLSGRKTTIPSGSKQFPVTGNVSAA